MKKTIKKKVEIIVKNSPINLLSVSFGQEDLNKMAEKINEIIVHLNNVV